MSPGRDVELCPAPSATAALSPGNLVALVLYIKGLPALNNRIIVIIRNLDYQSDFVNVISQNSFAFMPV